MTASGYVLTDEAEADLRGVIRRTREKWDSQQVRRYLATVEKSIVRLAAGQAPFKDLSDIYPTLRMARCEHHYVFCLPRADGSALIVAFFQERMDLMTRVADRLT